MRLSQAVIDFLMTHDGPVVIAVSGGPDSMCVVALIRDFWVEQGRNQTDLHVAHYHHGLRSQSDEERDLVIQYCRDMTVHVGYYDEGSHTERDLRVARHVFFQSVMEDVGSSVLIIGHNLTDRIETSLMNMRRGCQVRGFVNMREVEQIRNYTLEIKNIVLRPLLSYPKQQIQEYCDEQKIPYMVDESNADVSVSQRNQIRHEVVMKLTNQELENRQRIYARLEAGQTIYTDPVRDEQMQGWYAGNVGKWDLEYLVWLFDWSGCYNDMTQGRLLERQQWIARSFSGEKFVGGWRWRIKHKGVYMGKIK